MASRRAGTPASIVHRDQKLARVPVEVRLRIVEQKIARTDREVLDPARVEEVEDLAPGGTLGRFRKAGPIQ
jgi:hypothetical protein